MLQNKSAILWNMHRVWLYSSRVQGFDRNILKKQSKLCLDTSSFGSIHDDRGKILLDQYTFHPTLNLILLVAKD